MFSPLQGRPLQVDGTCAFVARDFPDLCFATRARAAAISRLPARTHVSQLVGGTVSQLAWSGEGGAGGVSRALFIELPIDEPRQRSVQMPTAFVRPGPEIQLGLRHPESALTATATGHSASADPLPWASARFSRA